MAKTRRRSSVTDTQFRTFCKKIPLLYQLLCTEEHQYKKLKHFCGFICGILIGITFYNFIIVDLDFTEDAAFIVGSTICLMLGFGIAFSSQIRCITLLSAPSFGGKVGRGVLKAAVLTFLISGPVENLTLNGKEVVRVFACTASLTFNLTKARFELMFKPFAQAIFGMKTEVNEVKDTLRSIKDASAPVTGEIEDEKEMKKLKEENDYLDEKMGDTKRSKESAQKYNSAGEKIEAERYEKKYLQKIEMRCENQFTRAAQRCRDMFAKAYNACYDTVTWVAAWLLCWPMKLDFICNIAEAIGGSGRCDPSKEIDPGFGQGYSYLKESRSSFSKNFRDVRMQYKIGKIKQLKDLRDARDTAAAVLHVVNAKKSMLMQILSVLKRVLAFVFLRIILDSQSYHDKYLRDIEYDNIYITKFFRKLDARRRTQEKHTLLPLKKIEKKKLVDPLSKIPLKSEREKIVTETVLLLLEMMVATILILLDRLFYEILDMIQRHARIDYLQTGHHDLIIDVKGTGMIASLLRSIVKGFNIKKRIRIERSNVKCLPRPRLMPYQYLVKIYGIYFVIWVMMLLQAYTQRLRRYICAYFYRRREKRRIIFLYNETLKRRIGFFRFMKKKVKKKVREHRLKEDFNVFMILRMNYPKVCQWLQCFSCARRSCIICEEREPRTKGDFVECPNEYCNFLYCRECWIDLGNVCIVCETEAEDTSSGFDDGDDDEFDSD